MSAILKAECGSSDELPVGNGQFEVAVLEDGRFEVAVGESSTGNDGCNCARQSGGSRGRAHTKGELRVS